MLTVPPLLADLPQAPVFISFFIALRKMAYLPVPSLQTGGALWFTDLSAADPFYILPLAVTGTMFFILELCCLGCVKNICSQAVFTYWLTSNCFSLGQVALLRHPAVRRRFMIPERIKHPASAMPQSDGLIESMKKGPLRQTFTHNPLQQTPGSAAASAKQKEAGVKAKPWKNTIG
ncbi:hypothetical protein GOODEAATRI_001241 [Goodea atripinnis]|uniref:Uncharacterized protein n=1 Tax=Goodea atripinnis TaxID=208336 RepID=A0ABV0NGM6_9TELE